MILSLPARAEDSVDYMMDGKMTKEEMEAEARYVADLCFAQPIKNTYFDCACIGGKFLLERERLGPYELQPDIVYRLYRDKECTNKPAIAGEVFDECIGYVAFFERNMKNYNDYCKCVANTTADFFSKTPTLYSKSIQRIRARAMAACTNTPMTEQPAIEMAPDDQPLPRPSK